MAYIPFLEFSFLEAYPERTGTVAQRRRVSFRKQGYTGEIVEVLPGGEPMELSYEDNSDNRFSSILPSKLTLNLVCQEYWQAEVLYVDSDRVIQVFVELDTTGSGDHYEIDWVGWVLAQDLKEEFESKPYRVKLLAACGLSTLKDRPLLDASGTRLKDVPLVSTVIRTALALAETVPGMVSGMNLYETQDVAVGQTSGGLARVERDPLNRVRQDAASLINDKNEAISAYDTLKKELETFGLRVAQVKGQWFVIRADEAAGGWDKWNTNSNSTIHTRQYTQATPNVGPSGHAGIDLNVFVGPGYPNVVLAGSTTWLENPKLGVRVEQSFGGFKNNLADGRFNQVDSTGLPVGWLRKNISDPNRAKRIGTSTDADPYRVRIYGWEFNNYEEDNSKGIRYHLHWNENDPGDLAIIRANRKIARTLSFDFRLYNARGCKVVIRCSAYGFGGPWWILNDNNTWTLNPKRAQRSGCITFNDIVVNGTDKTKPGWKHVEISIPPVDFYPDEGGINDLDIMLCSAQPLAIFNQNGDVLGPVDDPNAYIEYANVSLTKEDKSINITGTQRTIVQKNKTAETVLSMTLGDVPSVAQPEAHTGTLYKLQDGNVPTTRWYRPNANILDPNPSGDNVGKPLIDWNVESRARQDMHAALTFEGTLYGRLPFGIHSVLRFYGLGEVDSNGVLQLYPFQITRLASRFRSMEHDFTAVRMLTGVNLPAGAAYTDVSEWVTPDGTIYIDYDPATNEPLPVTPLPVEGPDVSLKNAMGRIGVKLTKDDDSLLGVWPALFVPQDENDNRFTATGYVGGVKQGTTVSAFRKQDKPTDLG